MTVGYVLILRFYSLEEGVGEEQLHSRRMSARGSRWLGTPWSDLSWCFPAVLILA